MSEIEITAQHMGKYLISVPQNIISVLYASSKKKGRAPRKPRQDKALAVRGTESNNIGGRGFGQSLRQLIVLLKKPRLYVGIQLGEKVIRVHIDTGASCSVMPNSFLPADTKLDAINKKLITYSNSKLSVLATVTLNICYLRTIRNM